jgi:hypothetical protein
MNIAYSAVLRVTVTSKSLMMYVKLNDCVWIHAYQIRLL